MKILRIGNSFPGSTFYFSIVNFSMLAEYAIFHLDKISWNLSRVIFGINESGSCDVKYPLPRYISSF
jgi:hypothetical protein